MNKTLKRILIGTGISLVLLGTHTATFIYSGYMGAQLGVLAHTIKQESPSISDEELKRKTLKAYEEFETWKKN